MLFKEDRIILDLCGGTGAWSELYADAGYDVRLVTLPEQDVTDYIPPANVYGILAAPPCTMFSMARTTAKTPRDFIQGMIPVNACYRIIYMARPNFWALENPLGHISKWIGKHKYWFHPWWFGDPWTKRTGIWGNFSKPKRKYHKINDVLSQEQIEAFQGNRRALQIANRWRGEKAKVLRAVTPPGFAKAFFEANQ